MEVFQSDISCIVCSTPFSLGSASIDACFFYCIYIRHIVFMYLSDHIAATTWTSQVTGCAYFLCQLKRLSCLLDRFICAPLGSFPLVPTTSLRNRFPSHPEVTPLRTQLPWLIMTESHLQGSVLAHYFHGWSAPRSLEPRATSTLLTASTPVNSQGHLKWKCGILALSRHTKQLHKTQSPVWQSFPRSWESQIQMWGGGGAHDSFVFCRC